MDKMSRRPRELSSDDAYYTGQATGPRVHDKSDNKTYGNRQQKLKRPRSTDTDHKDPTLRRK